MKKSVKITLIALLSGLLFVQAVQAGHAQGGFNDTVAKKQIQRYLNNLQTGNADDMANLFMPNGYVYSTTKGKMNAITFFNAFLPQIKTAQVTIRNIYKQDGGYGSWYAASFHYTYIMKDGEQGGGDYTDEFRFHIGSDRLDGV